MKQHAPIQIRPARGAADMAIVADLFREYQAWLGVDLCFQDFDRELADLPGRYAPSAGEIYLAVDGDDVAGIVGVRPIGDAESRCCEMKRLYVPEPWRGRGLGRRLARRAMSFARDAGYRQMVLDTLPRLETARAMYARMGFDPIEPYYDNPLPGVVYMRKIL